MNQDILHKYFKGIATHEEEAQILDWVDASPENQKQFQKERMLFDIALFSETSAKRKTVKRYITPVLKWTAGIAAAVLVAVSCSLLFQEFSYNAMEHLQTVTVPAGQRAQIVLADGTTVWLNSQSTLTYQADFGRKNRDVRLNGEAFFDVTPNKDIPFNVNTQINQIRVVGTKFNVCSYDNTNNFEAALVEGMIDIYSAHHNKVIARMQKDEFLSISNGVMKHAKLDSQDFLRWREGIYCFDDIPLSELFAKLEKYYNVEIVVENKDILSYRCTGKFKERDGIEHILKVIQKDYKFTYKIDVEQNRITIK